MPIVPRTEPSVYRVTPDFSTFCDQFVVDRSRCFALLRVHHDHYRSQVAVATVTQWGFLACEVFRNTEPRPGGTFRTGRAYSVRLCQS